MDTIEMTDPDGDALTLFLEDEQIWITCTSGPEEVTIGPLPSPLVRRFFLGADEVLSATPTAQELVQHLALLHPEEAAVLVDAGLGGPGPEGAGLDGTGADGAVPDGAPPHLEIVAEGAVDPAPRAEPPAGRDERREA